jgi:hypothetical protein
MDESRIINWRKMVTSFTRDWTGAAEPEPALEERIPSLLQRFKAKFQRPRVN